MQASRSLKGLASKPGRSFKAVHNVGYGRTMIAERIPKFFKHLICVPSYLRLSTDPCFFSVHKRLWPQKSKKLGSVPLSSFLTIPHPIILLCKLPLRQDTLISRYPFLAPNPLHPTLRVQMSTSPFDRKCEEGRAL